MRAAATPGGVAKRVETVGARFSLVRVILSVHSAISEPHT